MNTETKQQSVTCYVCRIIVLVVATTISFLFMPGAQRASADSCGGATVCHCGDVVTSSYILPADLTCSEDGLYIGSDGVTLDGGGHSLTGSGEYEYYGLSINGSASNVTIRDFSNITSFDYGIFVSSDSGYNIENVTANSNLAAGIVLAGNSGNTISGCTTNNNTSYGILLEDSSDNTITNNTSNNNLGDIRSGNPSAGIGLDSSSSNIITSNTTNNNSQYGIKIYLSNNNTFTSNSASGNRKGNISNFNLSSTGNSINTTNLVEGKPVYYLSGASNTIYDGIDAGMFNCFSCTNITLKNTTLASNNEYAISFKSSTGSVIQGNIVPSSNYGIYMNGSLGTISGNTISGSDIGLSPSGSSTISGNTFISNKLALSSSGLDATSTVSNNLFLKNKTSYANSATAVFQNNKFFHDLDMDNTVAANRINMLRYTDTARSYSVGDTISFSFSTLTANGTACSSSTCTYAATISPTNTSLSSSLTGDTVTGSFVPDRNGTYSLLLSVTDTNGNETKRNIVFMVGSTSSTTTRYYFRSMKPTHAQAKGNGLDSSTLMLTPPSSDEYNWCSGWVQYSPDETPNYPISSVSSLDSLFYYILDLDAAVGTQRYARYGTTSSNSASSAVTASPSYISTSETLNSLNFMMDYQQSWQSIRFTLGNSSNSTYHPRLRSTASSPSYIDFAHSYTNTPAVKTISNDDVILVSATSSDATGTDPSITLNNPTLSSASANLVLDDFSKPFSNATTIINSDGSATVSATLAAEETSTYGVADMLITPSTGTVTVDIDTWNTSGDYSKSWSEDGSTHDITTEHTIGDMKPSTSYALSIDGVFSNYYFSSSSGEITFNYTGGYSSHTFELTEATSDVSPSATPTSLTISSIEVLPETGVDKYLFWAMGLV